MEKRGVVLLHCVSIQMWSIMENKTKKLSPQVDHQMIWPRPPTKSMAFVNRSGDTKQRKQIRLKAKIDQ